MDCLSLNSFFFFFHIFLKLIYFHLKFSYFESIVYLFFLNLIDFLELLTFIIICGPPDTSFKLHYLFNYPVILSSSLVNMFREQNVLRSDILKVFILGRRCRHKRTILLKISLKLFMINNFILLIIEILWMYKSSYDLLIYLPILNKFKQ